MNPENLRHITLKQIQQLAFIIGRLSGQDILEAIMEQKVLAPKPETAPIPTITPAP